MADEVQITVDLLDLHAYAECAKWVSEAFDALEQGKRVVLQMAEEPERSGRPVNKRATDG